MAITEKLPDGSTVVLEGSSWRRLTPEEEQAAQMSGPEIFGRQLGANVGRLSGLAGGLMGLNQRLQGGDPQNPLTDYAAAREPLTQAMESMDPGRALAGQLWLDPLNLAFGAGSAAGRGGRLAQRVLQGIDQAAARGAAAGEARQGAERLARSGIDEYGIPQAESTAGAQATAAPRGLLERLREEFTTPVALTDQQQAASRALQDGLVSFRPLPGQLQGSRLTLSGIKSNPMWIAEFEPELVANYRATTSALKTGMGLPEATPFTDEITGLADEVIGARFDRVRDSMTQGITLSPEAAEVVTPALTAFERKAISLQQELSPAQVFEVRSQLGANTRKLARDGDMTGLRATVQAMDEIDGAIEAQIGETGMADWLQAKQQHRLKLLLDASNSVSPSGQLNVASLNRTARHLFGRQYQGWGPRKGLLPETARALDQIKIAAAFPDAVGNSGTAERIMAAQAFRNPVTYARDRSIGRAIRWFADQTGPPPMAVEP